MPVDTHNNGARKIVTATVLERDNTGTSVMTGDVTLTAFSAQHLKLDTGGSARDLNLPPAENGHAFHILNVGAEVLTIKNPAGGTVLAVPAASLAEVRVIAGAWVSWAQTAYTGV